MAQEFTPSERTVLTILARSFDEKADTRKALAERAREDDSESFPEQDSIGHTWRNAADMAWQLAGGRPNDVLHVVRFVKIGLPELGRLVEYATSKAHVESTAKACEFGDGLIDKLAATFAESFYANETDMRAGVRAVVSELAKTPCEWPIMPNFAEVQHAYERTKPNAGLEAVMKLYEQRVAFVIAAKDARNAELEALYAAAKVTDPEQAETIELQRRRIVEIEARLPANECSNAERCQYEATIEQQKTRIAELEESNKRAWIERDMFYARATEDPTKAQLIKAELERDTSRGDYATAVQVVEQQRGRIAELEKLTERFHVGASDGARNIWFAELRRQYGWSDDEHTANVFNAAFDACGSFVTTKHEVEIVELRERIREHESIEPGSDLAACHEEIDRLRAMAGELSTSDKIAKERIVELEAERDHTKLVVDGWKSVSEVQTTRIVELDDHYATMMGLASRYLAERDSGERTWQAQRDRIKALEKSLAESEHQNALLDVERHEAIEERKRAEARVKAWEARTGETSPRIVGARLEGSTPLIFDGKTPGQVLRAEYARIASNHYDEQEASEHVAQAVLLAFGRNTVPDRVVEVANKFVNAIDILQRDSAKQAIDVLQRMRAAVDKAQSFDVTNNEGKNDYAVLEDDVFEIINNELAKLNAPSSEGLSAIAIGERLWPRMNERRCAIVKKLVTMGAVNPEENAELHALEAVRRARAELFDALMQVKSSRMPDVDEAFQAFANTDEFMDGILGHELDGATFVLVEARENQLSAKSRAGIINDTETRMLAQLLALMTRPKPWLVDDASAP